MAIAGMVSTTKTTTGTVTPRERARHVIPIDPLPPSTEAGAATTAAHTHPSRNKSLRSLDGNASLSRLSCVRKEKDCVRVKKPCETDRIQRGVWPTREWGCWHALNLGWERAMSVTRYIGLRREGGPLRLLSLLLGVTIFAALMALPTSAMAAGSIGALSINPDSVRNGESTTGTVDLGFPDAEPTVVRLFSSDPSVAQVPVSMTIPAGQTSGTFTITSTASAPPTIVQIMGATPDNISRTHNLSVNAATPAGPSLSSVSFVPTSVVGGQSATGTVRFTGPMTQ